MPARVCGALLAAVLLAGCFSSSSTPSLIWGQVTKQQWGMCEGVNLLLEPQDARAATLKERPAWRVFLTHHRSPYILRLRRDVVQASLVTRPDVTPSQIKAAWTKAAHACYIARQHI